MNLDDARQYVDKLIEDHEVPLALPGGISLEDLIPVVTAVANSEIKKHLSVDGMSEEALQTAVEQIAMRMALICLYVGGDDPADADVALGISSETVTEVLRRLLSGNPVSISLSVDDD